MHTWQEYHYQEQYSLGFYVQSVVLVTLWSQVSATLIDGSIGTRKIVYPSSTSQNTLKSGQLLILPETRQWDLGVTIGFFSWDFFFFYLLHKGQMLVYSTWSLKYSLHKTWEDILNYLKATQCRKYTQHLKITFQFCITKLITRTVERHTKKKWESVFQSEKLYKDR